MEATLLRIDYSRLYRVVIDRFHNRRPFAGSERSGHAQLAARLAAFFPSAGREGGRLGKRQLVV